MYILYAGMLYRSCPLADTAERQSIGKPEKGHKIHKELFTLGKH